MPLTDYAQDILNSKFLTQEDQDWVIAEIEDLVWRFDNPSWPLDKANDLHTQAQVGYLSGVMDLEREHRIEVVEMIMGFPLMYVLGEWFPGVAEPLEPDNYPGASLKDVRITRWEMSVLIDYYIAGNGSELNERLGYTSKTTIRTQKRLAKAALKQKDADGSGGNGSTVAAGDPLLEGNVST